MPSGKYRSSGALNYREQYRELHLSKFYTVDLLRFFHTQSNVAMYIVSPFV